MKALLVARELRIMKTLLVGMLVGFVCCVAGQAEDGASRQARDIFYSPAAAPAANQAPDLALRYQILLKRGDFVGFVPEGYQFRSGDQFRIYFEASCDGYAYIFNRGTTGQGTVLFPDSRINGGANKLSGHAQSTVPAEGWYEFDNRPGVEELFVFFSDKPLHDLEQASQSPVIEQTIFQQTVTTMVEQRKSSRQSRDIVYVEEGQSVAPPSPPQPAPSTPAQPVVTPVVNTTPVTYVGTPSKGKDNLLIHTIKLNHN